MFKHREYKGFLLDDYYPEGTYLLLDGDKIDETVKFMRDEKIYGLSINCATGYKIKNVDCLHKFGFVKHLHILHHWFDDISPIYYLSDLETISLETDESAAIHFDRFPKLKDLAFEWRPKCDSLFGCTQLESLNIHGYKAKTNDLLHFSNLTNLKWLGLVTSPIQSLAGIENLQKLEVLSLNYMSKLTDIEHLKYLKNLVNLEFESCKSIASYEPISKLKQLKRLSLDKMGDIPTVQPFSILENLEKLSFLEKTTITDGNLASLLNLTKLIKLHITRRKHYSHTDEDILKTIQEKNKVKNYELV